MARAGARAQTTSVDGLHMSTLNGGLGFNQLFEGTGLAGSDGALIAYYTEKPKASTIAKTIMKATMAG